VLCSCGTHAFMRGCVQHSLAALARGSSAGQRTHPPRLCAASVSSHRSASKIPRPVPRARGLRTVPVERPATPREEGPDAEDIFLSDNISTFYPPPGMSMDALFHGPSAELPARPAALLSVLVARPAHSSTFGDDSSGRVARAPDDPQGRWHRRTASHAPGGKPAWGAGAARAAGSCVPAVRAPLHRPWGAGPGARGGGASRSLGSRTSQASLGAGRGARAAGTGFARQPCAALPLREDPRLRGPGPRFAPPPRAGRGVRGRHARGTAPSPLQTAPVRAMKPRGAKAGQGGTSALSLRSQSTASSSRIASLPASGSHSQRQPLSARPSGLGSAACTPKCKGSRTSADGLGSSEHSHMRDNVSECISSELPQSPQGMSTDNLGSAASINPYLPLFPAALGGTAIAHVFATDWTPAKSPHTHKSVAGLAKESSQYVCGVNAAALVSPDPKGATRTPSSSYVPVLSVQNIPGAYGHAVGNPQVRRAALFWPTCAHVP
jgi:hypothetical protein